MTLLWTRIGKYYDDDEHWLPMTPHREEHREHSLHQAFAGAGIKPSPCGYSLCDDFDQKHSDAFDEAERRNFRLRDKGRQAPVERVDLSKPVHGFENTADMGTLHHYQDDPHSHATEHPTWFRHQGEHYIMDGHHRTAAAMRRGDRHMPVHMIDLDKDEDA